MANTVLEQEAVLMPSLQMASTNWTGFEWPTKAKQWDVASAQSKEAREQAQAARKQLAETTKQFKRSVKAVEQAGSSLDSSNTDENASTTVKAIDVLAKNCRLTVKAYQEEIDNLTRRCKSSESAFSNLTQSLGELPDPSAVLSASLDLIHKQQTELRLRQQTVDELTKETASLEKKVLQAKAKPANETSGMEKAEKEELMQLRKDVAEYEVEFRSLKNQDITIRKLEGKIVQLQQGGEAEFNAELEKAKEELAETEGRRTAEALEREAAMERRVQGLELQLKAEKAGRAATQVHLLEASEGAGEREAAWEAQRRILVDDGDRLRVSLHQATRERDELRLKVSALEGSTQSAAAAPSSGGMAMSDLLTERGAYEAEVSELSHTVNTLREEISIKEQIASDEKHALQAKIDTLDAETLSLRESLSSLETQLASAPSHSLVDSMKRELRILKRLEYNVDDPELAEVDPEMTGRNEGQEKDLESVLVAKLRRVEAELVKERNSRTHLEEEIQTARKEISELEEGKAEGERVIASLEHDLDAAISSSTTQPQSGEQPRAPPSGSSHPTPGTLESVLDADAPQTPTPIAEVSGVLGDVTTSTSAAEKAADDHSVATIIMAQRDRLRARCEALEAERDSFKRELQGQVDAAESLKADNTKLFEKMRYLQSYSNSKPSSVGSYSRSNSRDLDLEALEQRYEASVDPFRQFSRAERQRKLREMSPMERTVYVVAKTVLGTKEMRTFLFFYVLAMHLLVFLTTYHWSHSDTGCTAALHEQLSHLPPMVDKSPEEVVKHLSGN